MLKYTILFILFGSSLWVNGQNSLRLTWYNVENLFDTIDSPDTNDEEYLPDSEKEWNSQKYWSKLNRMAKVLRNSTGYEAPDIIALCEIENGQVVYDLTHRPAFAEMDYRVIHYESPDFRGIDVALAYNPEKVHFFASSQIRVPIDTLEGRTTRDILLASGVWNQDTLHVFVNHWPSRRGGQAASNIKRVIASSTLLRAVDSLESMYHQPKIIVVGDFNDGPSNESIQMLKERGFHLDMENRSESEGTHRYAGHWEYLDQWIWSPSLADGTTTVDTSYIYMNEEMVEESGRYPGIQPKRSWRGNLFTSGYSDHLPIVLKITQQATRRVETR